MSSLPPELDFTANPAATPARMDEAMGYIASALRRAESLRPDFEAAIERLRAIGLERLDAVLSPIFVDAQGIAARLAAIEVQWLTGDPLAQLLASLQAQALVRLADADAAVQSARALIAGVRIGETVQAYSTRLSAVAGVDNSIFGLALLALTDAPALRAKAELGSIATLAKATAADYRAATADRALAAAEVWSAAAFVPIGDGATININMGALINGTLTLGGNRTLGAPVNAKVGQSGVIEIRQDATGSRTLAYASVWSLGTTVPTLSTAANARDLLYYQVMTDGKVDAYLSKAR